MKRRATKRSGVLGVQLIGLLLLMGMAMTVVGAQETGVRRWDFEKDRVGTAPAGFSFARTGQGRLGRWVVQARSDAPSGTHVLAQTNADQTDNRFPIAVADEPLLRDLRLAVSCDFVSGHVDQACGLVFRYQDDQNYYLTRANALEGNVRLYRVINGHRQQLISWEGAVTRGAWHALQVEAQDDRFTILWDGRDVLDARDQTFRQPGRVGVWTKADSVTAFDDLIVEQLER